LVPNVFGRRPTENPEQVLAQIPGLDFLKKPPSSVPPSSVPSPNSSNSNDIQSSSNDDDENKQIPFRRCLERSVHQQKHLEQQLHQFHQYIAKKRSAPKETLNFGNDIWLQQQQQQQQHCLFETQQQHPLFGAQQQQQQQQRLMDESSDDLANLETKFHYY